MLHAEAHEGREGAVVLGDGAFHLDLPEGDEEALLELGVEAEQPGGLPEVAAGRGERVHGGGGNLLLPPGPTTTATGKGERRRGEKDRGDRNARTREREQDRGAGGQKGQGGGREKGRFLSGDRGVPGLSGASSALVGLCFLWSKGGREGINRDAEEEDR